jgi:adenosine 3'-phospho 5'-phosphosulfate transporter B3
MVIGTALYKQRYPKLQYIAAVLLSFGLTIFVLADAQTSPNFHPLGLLIICLALFADAFIGKIFGRRLFPSEYLLYL